MRGEIICIGDELISGRINDRNASYAAARLWPMGLAPARVVMVGDDPRAIAEALGEALARADYLIVCGGLGTTEDDMTAQAAADYLGLALHEHPLMKARLEAQVRDRDRELTPQVRRMALVPLGAEPLDPQSAGFGLEDAQGRPLYFLPGVPVEFRRIIDQRVAPELARRFLAGVVRSRELLCYGLPESEVGRRLAGLIQGVEGLGLGYYPVFPEVKVVLTARAPGDRAAQELLEPLEAEARRRLEGYVLTSGGATLAEALALGLSQWGLSLALAESCTGGLIGHRLTQVPGASDFLDRGLVVYSNRAKQELLGVSAATLDSFGAVSAQCAREMAQGVRQNSGTDLGLAVTGIAGPGGGSPQKPVGTVFFGLSHAGGTQTMGKLFHGDRRMIKSQAAETALDWLRRHLEEHAAVRGA